LLKHLLIDCILIEYYLLKVIKQITNTSRECKVKFIWLIGFDQIWSLSEPFPMLQPVPIQFWSSCLCSSPSFYGKPKGSKFYLVVFVTNAMQLSLSVDVEMLKQYILLQMIFFICPICALNNTYQYNSYKHYDPDMINKQGSIVWEHINNGHFKKKKTTMASYTRKWERWWLQNINWATRTSILERWGMTFGFLHKHSAF
jgi:hypothetical protein